MWRDRNQTAELEKREMPLLKKTFCASRRIGSERSDRLPSLIDHGN
jgi:hypothetical protein